jgi:lipopolysaccharide export system protein LptC
VGIAKRLLPLVALLLLSLVAFWPEMNSDERSRWAAAVRGLEPQSGQLSDVRYRGVDERNRPYAVTASGAQQVSPERINLVEPKGDVNLESGVWLMAQSRSGVYMPHADQLDLSGDVVLYRDDGLTMTTDSATLDLKAGVASSADQVHVEGPFGSLDAQGFAVIDRGQVLQFTGPGRLVLNGRPQ